MRKKEIKNIVEFIEVIESISIAEFWYRGINNSEYDLIPGLYWRNLEKYESSLVHRFMISYNSFHSGSNLNSWQLYALMQHHKLPTRLLDWTRSPLIALYFALENYNDFDQEAAIILIDPRQLNKKTLGEESLFSPGSMKTQKIEVDDRIIDLNDYLPELFSDKESSVLPELPIAIEAPLSFPRISSQDACFTLHGKSKIKIDELFEEIENPVCDMLVFKGKEVKEKLLYSLFETFKLTEDKIYNDLDSLSKRLIREYS